MFPTGGTPGLRSLRPFHYPPERRETGLSLLAGRFSRKDYIASSPPEGRRHPDSDRVGTGENPISTPAPPGAVIRGGSIRCLGDHMVIKEADEILLFIGCVTSFRSDNPRDAVLGLLDRAADRSWRN